VVTISREVLVGSVTLALAALGARRIDVLWVGKAGTFGLMFAYPAFLLSHGSAGWQDPFRTFAWVAGLGGLTLAWIAALSYLVPARRALIEGRQARRESQMATRQMETRQMETRPRGVGTDQSGDAHTRGWRPPASPHLTVSEVDQARPVAAPTGGERAPT